MVLSAHICRRHASSVRALQRENNRSADDWHDFPLSDINWDKTWENKYFVCSDDWFASIKAELAKYGISDYRKNAVLLIDVIYSASADFFEINEPETIEDYFKDCLRFHENEFGHIINAIVHYDETTPHMHVVSVPIVEREKGYALCARDMIPGKQKLYAFHDHLYQEVGCNYDLERGKRSDSLSKKKHLDMYRYKLHCLQEKIADAGNDLEKLKTEIEKAGSLKALFASAVDISSKLSLLIGSIDGYTIDVMQTSIEMRDTLLVKDILVTGCNIHSADGNNTYCYVTDSSDEPLKWSKNKSPLFVQEGTRLIPSRSVFDNDHIMPWKQTDICCSKRSTASYSPVEKMYQIATELDNLIDKICPEIDRIELDNNDVDQQNDD